MVEELLAAVVVRHHFFVRVLDCDVQNARVTFVHVDADPAEHALWQTLANLDPVVAPVARLVEATSRSTQVEGERETNLVVASSIKRVRVGRIHHRIDHADRASLDLGREDLIPASPAIRGLVEPSLVVLGVEMAERRHVDDVGVGGVHDDAPDVVRFRKADVRPRLTLVGRLVDAVSPVGRPRVVAFARTQVEHIRVGGSDRDGSDRVDILILEQHVERDSVVRRPPQVPGGRSDVERVGLLSRHGDIDEPPALAGRADLAVLEVPKHVGGQALAGSWRRDQDGCDDARTEGTTKKLHSRGLDGIM